MTNGEIVGCGESPVIQDTSCTVTCQADFYPLSPTVTCIDADTWDNDPKCVPVPNGKNIFILKFYIMKKSV